MPESPIQQQKRHRRLRYSVEWLVLLIGIAIGLLLTDFLKQVQADVVFDFLGNLVPEAVGIFFTVAILDRLNARREDRLIREQLVRRAHSRHNQTALSAIEELRVLGVLEGSKRRRGALAGLALRGSNWENANLYQADLRGCDLTNARLHRADLVMANMEGATVSHEQLAVTDTMRFAIMPNGRRYDGRYKLVGDYERAKADGVDIASPEDMQRWYGIEERAFSLGNIWANRYLHRIKDRSEHYDLTDIHNQIH